MIDKRDGQPLIRGKPFIVGNKVMAVCSECGTLVRLDKPLLGSLHLCT